MASLKTLAGAALLAVTATTASNAQAGRPFHDSWFWGVRSGAMTYGKADPLNPTGPGSSSVAPMIGFDWLITRSSGGLYVSFAQAFLSAQGSIENGPAASDTGLRVVDLKNARRFDMALMTFPGTSLTWHPYVGAGFSFKYLAGAEAAGPFTQQRQIDFATEAVDEVKASMGPLLIAGTQYRFRRISAFGQVTLSTASKEFLLSNGHSSSTSFEFGVRYNIGSSIAR